MRNPGYPRTLHNLSLRTNAGRHEPGALHCFVSSLHQAVGYVW